MKTIACQFTHGKHHRIVDNAIGELFVRRMSMMHASLLHVVIVVVTFNRCPESDAIDIALSAANASKTQVIAMSANTKPSATVLISFRDIKSEVQR
jgi:hypothetical protein